MNAVADENIPGLAQTFGAYADLQVHAGRTLTREDLGDADILLVRSVTRVGAELLEGSRVRFVGTATIGTDHLDVPWLEANGVTWASAPGCNAAAAAQYTLGMILLACNRLDRRLEDLTVGLFGRGHVGTRVQRLLENLGVATRACDPPLEAAGATGLVEAEAALDCDVVSLHVPLTRHGPWPTEGMIGDSALQCMKPGTLLVNSSRGPVIDESSMHEALNNGRIDTALDVWPREPLVTRALLEAATVATPHVAGYSVEGKLRGTQMIFDAFLRWLGVQPASDPPGLMQHLPTTPVHPEHSADGRNLLQQIIIEATQVEQDDARMRSAGTMTASQFDQLRRAHGPRHEFEYLALEASMASPETAQRLGFSIHKHPGMR